ncbi:MAG TPA: hypothetical protein VLA77_02340 [Candidatus Saccharimonadales bacterium]|nr:hypothetical protein [Candidatus Saccharimonadales bacterium]
MSELVHPKDLHDSPFHVQEAAYTKNAGRLKYDAERVIKNTKVPKGAKIPKILGWSGPARSGTTALLFLMGGHAQVDRLYFQPQKSIMRQADVKFELFETDNFVCMKEVFGQFYSAENYDPIDLLLKAGVPEANIAWISLLRDPMQCMASWYHKDPRILKAAQDHTLDIYQKYQGRVKMVPFVYELLRGNELKTIKALLRAVGLDDEIDLKFNIREIGKKLVPFQAGDESFYKVHVQAIFERENFTFGQNNYSMNPETILKVKKICLPAYEDFYRHSKKVLML